MKYPILEFYSDEGVINKESYMRECAEDFKNLGLIKKYNIDTLLDSLTVVWQNISWVDKIFETVLR